VSSVIAAEMSLFGIKLSKKNITRWNSILFMIRSVLRVSKEQFKDIRKQMPFRTAAEKTKNFDLLDVERSMLEELKAVLEIFEFITDEFQSNRVSIFRVYPCVMFAREELLKDIEKCTQTVLLRKELFKSLNSRFSNDIIDQDVFVISMFLDPNFGIDIFHPEKKALVKKRVKNLMKLNSIVTEKSIDQSSKESLSKLDEKRKSYYTFHHEETNAVHLKDKYDESTNEFISFVRSSDSKNIDALSFWRSNESRFPLLIISYLPGK
jgi:hypothetical protein